MMNLVLLLVGWLVTAVVAWLLWTKIFSMYLTQKFRTNPEMLCHWYAICKEVTNISAKDGKFVEWMRFIIFPCGIVQRTWLTMSLIKKYQEEAQ